jgi:serine/threonine protein kinase
MRRSSSTGICTIGQPDDFVARFQREARLAASLRHANIVHIYHFGGQQNIVYMVQELLPGPTLEQRMRAASRRRLAAERVLAIIDQLVGPLDYAYGQGVIHRDIKPSNALYNATGQLVLTDFGIARNITNPAQAATEPGLVMGTPGYVAPEQAISSVALTPACDIYALGALLFELPTIDNLHEYPIVHCLSSMVACPHDLRYSRFSPSSKPALTNSSASVSTSIGPVSASQKPNDAWLISAS